MTDQEVYYELMLFNPTGSPICFVGKFDTEYEALMSVNTSVRALPHTEWRIIKVSKEVTERGRSFIDTADRRRSEPAPSDRARG